MGILSQIISDYGIIQKQIAIVRAGKFTKDGSIITGSEREQLIEELLAEKNAELTRLRILLLAGVPSHYFSEITGENYHASPEELKYIEKRPFEAGKHSMFPMKLSRKNTHLQRSQFELYESPTKKLVNFFIEHKSDHSYPSGSFAAKVKKGYSTADEKVSKFAVKIFKKNQFTNTMHEARIAMRSAFCNRLLGRTGYAFRRNDKQYVVTDWLIGMPLSLADQKIITTMPIKKRINLALMLINEIAILHKHGIIHCDIKPENVMISDDALHLFDLDSVRLEKENIVDLKDSPMYTPNYLDAQNNYDIKKNPASIKHALNKKSDVFALGITLAFLFPDVLQPNSAKIKIPVKGKVSSEVFEFDGFQAIFCDKFEENQNLGNLILKLITDRAARPSIEEIQSELFKILKNNSTDKDEVKVELKAELKESILPVKFDSSSYIAKGREAFMEIESELMSFNSRIDSFNKGFKAS